MSLNTETTNIPQASGENHAQTANLKQQGITRERDGNGVHNSKTTITRITTRYSLDNFPDFDNAVIGAVGRSPDHSGAGFGERDMIWDCKSEIEAHKIKNGLKKIGLVAEEKQWKKQ